LDSFEEAALPASHSNSTNQSYRGCLLARCAVRTIDRAFVYPVSTVWRNRSLIRVMVRRGRYDPHASWSSFALHPRGELVSGGAGRGVAVAERDRLLREEPESDGVLCRETLDWRRLRAP
jgi:hypothetical protein